MDEQRARADADAASAAAEGRGAAAAAAAVRSDRKLDEILRLLHAGGGPAAIAGSDAAPASSPQSRAPSPPPPPAHEASGLASAGLLAQGRKALASMRMPRRRSSGPDDLQEMERLKLAHSTAAAAEDGPLSSPALAAVITAAATAAALNSDSDREPPAPPAPLQLGLSPPSGSSETAAAAGDLVSPQELLGLATWSPPASSPDPTAAAGGGGGASPGSITLWQVSGPPMITATGPSACDPSDCALCGR